MTKNQFREWVKEKGLTTSYAGNTDSQRIKTMFVKGPDVNAILRHNALSFVKCSFKVIPQ